MTAPNNTPCRRIAILGATLEGWIAAAFLARLLGKNGGEIYVVPQATDIAAPPALATHPGYHWLHAHLGLDEIDIVKSCAGTFRLGTLYRGETTAQEGFVHCFSAVGGPIKGAGFHQHWLRLDALDPSAAAPFDSYSLEASAARAGHFGKPDGQIGPFTYGLHLDGALYTDYMRRCALHYGAKLTKPLAKASLDRETNRVVGLDLTDGTRLDAEFYLDATGPAATLLDALAPGEHHGSLRPWANHMAWSSKTAEDNPCLTTASRQPLGWKIAVPLAKQTKTVLLNHEMAPDGRSASEGFFAPGWRPRPWVGNCIGIGRTVCTLPPLEGPEARMIEAGLHILREFFPHADGVWQQGQAEYNRRMVEIFTRFDEFQILQDCLSQGRIPEDLPPAIARKIEQWDNRGRVVTYDGESFEDPSFIACFLGNHRLPRHYDPLADAVPEQDVAKLLNTRKAAIETTISRMPSQRAMLTRLHQPRQSKGPI